VLSEIYITLITKSFGGKTSAKKLSDKLFNISVIYFGQYWNNFFIFSHKHSKTTWNQRRERKRL